MVTDSRHHNSRTDRRQVSQISLLILLLGSPPPGSYTLKSEFEIGRPGTTNTVTKGGIYSFGIGREKYEKVYMPSRTINNDPLQPGPGTYTSSLYSVGTEGRKFAF